MECCAPYKTAVQSFFPNRRVPALIPVEMSHHGPRALPLRSDLHKQHLKFPSLSNRLILESSLLSEEMKEKYQGKVPYDIYFPTLQKKIDKQVCKRCYKYHATLLSKKEHLKVCGEARSKAVRKGKQTNVKKNTQKRGRKPNKSTQIKKKRLLG